MAKVARASTKSKPVFDAETQGDLLELLGRNARGRRTLASIERRVLIFRKAATTAHKQGFDNEFFSILKLTETLVAELIKVERLWRGRDDALTDAVYGLVAIRDFALKGTGGRITRAGRPAGDLTRSFSEAVAWGLIREGYDVTSTEGGLFDRVLVLTLPAVGESSDRGLKHVMRSVVQTVNRWQESQE